MNQRFACALLVTVVTLPSLARTVQFADARPGTLPAGWQPGKTGAGQPHWSVVADASAPSPPNVLRQSGVAAFALCLNTNALLQNGHVEVKFKAVAGTNDQAAGVVWRVKDADNYYVCRANALENNAVLYKTVNGQRQALDIVGRQGGYGVQAKVEPSRWHTLRVEFAGNRFKVFLNGKALFEVEDQTLSETGNVGVWTKADSLTLFDDFSFGPD